MNKVKSWWAGVLQNIIGAGLWTAIFYVATLLVSGTVGAALLGWLTSRFTPMVWPVLIVAFPLSVILASIILERYDKRKPRLPRVTGDFLVLKKEISMEYSSLHRMVYRKGVKLKALKDNRDRLYDKYLWTGDSATVRSALPEHTVSLTRRLNIWQHYEVVFNRRLMKGQEIDTELVWTLSDENRESVPFISATVEAPTEALIFHLKVPSSWGVKSVDCEVSLGIGASTVVDSFSKSVGSNGTVTWRVDSPRLLYHYEMRWSLEGVEA